MNHIRIGLIAILIFIFSMLTASPALAQVSLPYSTDLLLDGREGALDVGDVTMNAYGMLSFEIDEAGTDWRLEATRVYVGDEPPLKIKPGNLPYAHEALGSAVSDDFYLELRAADLNDDGLVYIAAYAELTSQGGSSKKPRIITETALARGEESTGKGKNQISYFSVVVSG